MDMNKGLEKLAVWKDSLVNNIEKVFFGKKEAVIKILTGLLSNGHVLIEDIPGVGKTILARSIAQSISGTFSRVQCTPDLMPADITGISVFNPGEQVFVFHKGPVFSNILLVDEINRATPRTQSALLEAMAEGQVSVEGRVMSLPRPFLMLATENPVDFEGTFPLPEAQKDRFFISVKIGYPSRAAEEMMIDSQKRLTHPVTDIKSVTDPESIIEMQKFVIEVHADKAIMSYMLDIAEATRNNNYIALGTSPRGVLCLYRACQSFAALNGRDYVIPEDVREMVMPVLSKRIILSPECMIKGIAVEEILGNIMNSIKVPVIREAF